MSKTQRKVDLAIDEFVARVNGSPRAALDPEVVPVNLREGRQQAAALDWVAWGIVRAPSPCAWVDEFEAKLPGRLPRSYGSFVTRYLFPAFDVGPVTLFANTGGGVGERWELVQAAFWDEHLSTPLLAAGFVQFGRPSGGSYDPVCFDLNKTTNAGECPVVQLDHEAALMGGKVQVVADIAPSFMALLAREPR
ncbi:SMI1/KNR4 family protein [Anaeromyxobacter sp. PSR-1]|uniref:SMI1/KNR4 family protein n=1 Tax=Anaeromyxobacter sp. PSR-1 TaxID=1300915 RepID=UPI0005E095B8|nr:SMI1/KNR4 family protein [Anaeromyxobacter sp. PSR-1]GAO01228.1 hypothetical protein PSR1_00080 [Anaeromyxobacter sp. PSR-1]